MQTISGYYELKGSTWNIEAEVETSEVACGVEARRGREGAETRDLTRTAPTALADVTVRRVLPDGRTGEIVRGEEKQELAAALLEQLAEMW